jgi:hypothetical protein
MLGSSAAAPGRAAAAFGNRNRENEESHNLLEGLRGVGQFLYTFQRRLRFGKSSRSPLHLLRLELKGSTLECDWIARPPDAWDVDLPPQVAERSASLQALEDAMAVREFVFATLPEVSTAVLRGYRKSVLSAGLIIVGKVTRGEGTVRVLSPAMRAKLSGFQFCLENGILMLLPSE